MKNYFTFGQRHAHSVSGKTVDKNCIAVINADSFEEARTLAFEWFDNGRFHHQYSEEEFNKKKNEVMPYYPRGLIELN